MAQETVPTDAELAIDSLSEKSVIREVSIGVDYGKLILLPFGQTRIEGEIQMITKPGIGPVIELGYWSGAPETILKNGTYDVTGPYYRAGITYSLQILPTSFITLSALYGASNFSDEGLVQVESELWPDYNEAFERNEIVGTWTELVLGTEGNLKIKGWVSDRLYLGAKLRYRNLIKSPDRPEHDVLLIPGFGKTVAKSTWALNIYLKLKLVQ